MPRFTTQHYVEIASVVRERVNDTVPGYEAFHALRALTDSMGDMLAADNPSFDRTRFVEACGLAPRYQINRIFKDDATPAQVVERDVSLAEAKAHCSDPSTSTDEYMDTFTQEGD